MLACRAAENFFNSESVSGIFARFFSFFVFISATISCIN